MKNLFQQLNDLWVAITFAEAGEYDLIEHETQREAEDAVYVKAS
jgi:hypothetical protein